jgi:Phage capsid family
MNAPRPAGIPLRPDRDALAAEQRRAVSRMLTAVAIGGLKRRAASAIMQEYWPGDTRAGMLTKGAVSPTSTASFPAATGVAFLPSLAPQSAGVRLFERSLKLDFAGVSTYSVPSAATFPPPLFVGESAAIPVVQGDLDTVTVGPTRKLAFIVPISIELENYSAESASAIITRLMADVAGKALDGAIFSSVAADELRPAGLLNGVTPITAATGGGLDAMATDVRNMIAEMADAGLGGDDLIFIGHPTQAVSLRLLASPNFAAYSIFGTTAVAAGTIIGVVPNAIATGYGGTPEITTSRQASVHFEDTTPLQIATGPQGAAVVATPVKSAWQQGLLLLKLRIECAWGVVQSGAVQYVTGTSW